MELPQYFAYDGEFAAWLPNPDGGCTITISKSGDSFADFLQYGQFISFDELPKSFQKTVLCIESRNAKKLIKDVI